MSDDKDEFPALTYATKVACYRSSRYLCAFGQELNVRRWAPILAVLFGTAQAAAAHSHIPAVTPAVDKALHTKLGAIFARYKINAAGVGLIKHGRLVWTDYYGEQAPGIPVSASTEFNTGSITKTVTAETILRLVAARGIDLDEPMAPFWIDPDVKDDPRNATLTVRMALTHKSGFANWRFFAPDGKLRFAHDPGTVFGYSGEGYEYLRRFAEQKLGRSWEELVESEVFKPLGITRAAVGVHQANFPNIARRLDENGKFYGVYCRAQPPGWCREEGSTAAAADMVISVPDYARFLISVMDATGYEHRLAGLRDEIQTSVASDPFVDCTSIHILCPRRQGYGYGWQVLDYGNDKLVGHDGYDWSEITQTYFYTQSHDGLVIFLDAPPQRGQPAMAELIETLDPGSPLAPVFRKRAAAAALTK